MPSVERPISISDQTSIDLRPTPVAEVAHDDAADRPGDEADAERRERRERAATGETCGKKRGPNTVAAAVP